MECPYCHSQMIDGHIQSRGEVIKWLPANQSSLYTNLRWQVNKGEIKLGQYSIFTGGDVNAYRCEKCKKIIIDY